MAEAVFVTYLIAVSIYLTSAYTKECAVGPAYWCQSFQNAEECGALRHCTDTVWRYDEKQTTVESSTACEWCQKILENTHKGIQHLANNDELIKSTLIDGCKLLPLPAISSQCTAVMRTYDTSVRSLLEHQRYNTLCHLMNICPSDVTPSEKKLGKTSVDEQSKMLCHVLVRATHDLHVNQHKTRNEIQIFLKKDCQQLPDEELIQKCEALVHEHGTEIYAHVASKVELSKICDYLDDFVDHSAVSNLPPVHCELCSFVLSTAKYMLDAKHTEDKVLLYIDEQVCARLSGGAKKACQEMVLNNGKELINSIQSGTRSMLLCTRFQVCVDQVLDKTSPVPKNELGSFIKQNICDKLGSLKDACYAMMERDSTRLLQTVVQDLEGDVLCRMFGLCPQRMSFLDNLAVNDDKNKCQRCVDDFTRRKHIAERLVNHSAEFLHHLCEQLPEKDKCTQAVDDSIDELISFVRSLDPQDICVELKMCDRIMLKTIEPTQLSSSANIFSHEIIQYVKVEVCSKLGALAALCNKTMDTEGPAILATIAKDIDPKKACATIGVCPASTTFENCNDKCECCMNRLEVHEVQVATFLNAMVDSVKGVCQHMPGSDKCRQMTSKFDTNANKITAQFNAKRACQLLEHCSTTSVEIESLSQCQTRIKSKQQFLLASISTINQNLKSLCEYIPWNKDCYAIIDRSTLDVNDKVSQLNTETICTSGQSLSDHVCSVNNPFEKLCKQLVQVDENSSGLEALFKSMFNQNGHVEKDLCELEAEEPSSDCVSSVKLTSYKNKCDCCECPQFYTTKKTYNLNMIETLRSGLLATCDWSLSKDYCVSWFNRVCDRMKAKVDRFTPTTYCKSIGLCLIQQQTDSEQCKPDGDKCQCCTDRLTSRQNRFRTVVNQVTRALLASCTDDDCRSLVQSAQQKTLNQIEKINSQTLCQRYGYCAPEHSSQTVSLRSRLSANPYHHIGSSIEALDERLEAALSSDLCFQYGQLKPMCEHLIAPPQGHRYGFMYKALLENNVKLVADDLREQVSTKVNADVCTACKSAVQSAKDFWLNSLDNVRNVLVRTCERCSSKDECRDYYNQRYETIKSYLDTIDSNEFCQSIRLCSSSSLTIVKTDQCSMCVDRLENRKESVLRGVARLARYFDDICQRFTLKPCQIFVQQIEQSMEGMIKSFDPKETCVQIGFCSSSIAEKQMNFDEYEKYVEDEIEKTICSSLGPFESLCTQIVHGNQKQIQTLKINYNIRDLMQIGQDKTTNLFSSTNLNQCNRDQCQCCVDRIDQKKQCAKTMGDQIVSILSKSCDYCPTKGQCRQVLSDSQTQFDSFIDSFDSKQICVRLGFCNATGLCSKMGVFQEECERILTKFTQSSQQDSQLIQQHLPHTSVVVLPTEKEQINDSNSTCILCEYFMNILTNYIHHQSTEQDIKQQLDKVCQQMPKTLQKPCEEFIDNYGASIIATLINQFDLSTLCQKLNLCTKQMNVNLAHLTRANVASCGICDYVSTYVHFALKRDSTDKSVQHALTTVCTHLTNEQQSQCQTLVQLFGPHIRKLPLNLGGNFCQQLAICETPKDEKISSTIETDSLHQTLIHVPLKKDESVKKDDEIKRKIINNLDDTPECTLCHYVVSYLDAILKNNKSAEAIEAALAKVCNILPTKERSPCLEFVKTYGPVLAELISEVADPDTICRYLGVCQVSLPEDTTTKMPPLLGSGNHDYIHLSAQNTPFTCTICQFVVSRMKHLIELNQTEEEILASLKESCNLFSVVSLKKQCTDFLDQYGPYVIQMISSDIDPKVACQSIGICQKNEQSLSSTNRPQSTPVPISSSAKYGKCIFGMSYWCTSRQNAELCNAVELCERQVWSTKNKNIII